MTNNTNKHSIYTKCFDCGSWGINLLDNKQCGNCNRYDTTFYYSEEDLEFAIKKKETSMTNKLPEIRNENPPVISELSEEVKQALENLKILNKKCDDYLKLAETAVEMLRDTKTKLALEACLELIITFVNEQKNLINALDKQFGGK